MSSKVSGNRKYILHRDTAGRASSVIADHMTVHDGGVVEFYDLGERTRDMVLVYKLRDGESITWEERE